MAAEKGRRSGRSGEPAAAATAPIRTHSRRPRICVLLHEWRAAGKRRRGLGTGPGAPSDGGKIQTALPVAGLSEGLPARDPPPCGGSPRARIKLEIRPELLKACRDWPTSDYALDTGQVITLIITELNSANLQNVDFVFTFIKSY